MNTVVYIIEAARELPVGSRMQRHGKPTTYTSTAPVEAAQLSKAREPKLPQL
jgi:hypothetical protein